MVNKKSKSSKNNNSKKKTMSVKVSRRAPRRRNIHTPAGSFASATRAPFSQLAGGVKVPDGSPLKTSTVVLTRKFQVQSDANGEVDLVILPCLPCCAFTTRSCISGGTTLALASEAVTAGFKDTVTVTNARGVGFDTDSLWLNYSQFRIAAMGARYRGSAGVSVSGDLTAAVHPLKGLAPPLSTLIPSIAGVAGTAVSTSTYTDAFGPRNTMAAYLDSLGLPNTGSGNAGVIDVQKTVQLPVHGTMSAAEAAARGVHLRSVPFEPSARDFKRTAYRGMGTDAIDCAPNLLTNSQLLGVDYSLWKVGGNESMLVTGTAFAANTVIGNVELVYHLEVVPNPNLATLCRPTSVIDTRVLRNSYDEEISRVAHIPRVSFLDTVTSTADMLLGEVEGRVASEAASRGLGTIGGMLTRLLTIGA